MKRQGISETKDWWKDGIVYQIYPRSFMDSNGDGIGDLTGVISRLDYLNDGTGNSLGIDAIWFSPFYPSPMYDFGYDISDFKNIDPSYGTMADFDRLLSEAHKRGIKIILDFVPSHTSHLHPWFVESRGSRTNPKRDWYIWSQPSRPLKRSYSGGDKPPRRYRPNNWQSIFGGPAWDGTRKPRSITITTGSLSRSDVNWRNPDLRNAMYDQMRFWLDKGVDGFRLDVINFIFKDKQLRSNPYCIGRRPYDMQRHLYDKDLLPENLEVVREMRRLVDSYGDRMLVGEISNDDPNVPARYYGNGTDGLNLSFYFHFANQRFCPDSFPIGHRLVGGGPPEEGMARLFPVQPRPHAPYREVRHPGRGPDDRPGPGSGHAVVDGSRHPVPLLWGGNRDEKPLHQEKGLARPRGYPVLAHPRGQGFGQDPHAVGRLDFGGLFLGIINVASGESRLPDRQRGRPGRRSVVAVFLLPKRHLEAQAERGAHPRDYRTPPGNAPRVSLPISGNIGTSDAWSSSTSPTRPSASRRGGAAHAGTGARGASWSPIAATRPTAFRPARGASGPSRPRCFRRRNERLFISLDKSA